MSPGTPDRPTNGGGSPGSGGSDGEYDDAFDDGLSPLQVLPPVAHAENIDCTQA